MYTLDKIQQYLSESSTRKKAYLSKIESYYKNDIINEKNSHSSKTSSIISEYFFPFPRLPSDLHYHIISFLGPSDVGEVSLTSTELYDRAEEAIETLFFRIFGSLPENCSRKLTLKAVHQGLSTKTKHAQQVFLWSAAMGYTSYVKKAIESKIIDKFKHGINVGKDKEDDKTAFQLACGSGQIHILEMLLKAKCNPLKLNRYSGNALHVSAEKGQDKVIDFLMSKKFFSINSTDESRRSALYIASEFGHCETIKALIKYKPNLNCCNKDGKSPLHIASENNHIEAVRILIMAGIDIDLQTETGKTPLFIAAESGHPDICQILLDNQCNVRKPSYRNKIPLYVAAENGNTAVTRVLLPFSLQEDIFYLSNYGTTPMFIANKHPNKDVKKLLSQFILDCRDIKTKKKKRKANPVFGSTSESENSRNCIKIERPLTPRFAEEVKNYHSRLLKEKLAEVSIKKSNVTNIESNVQPDIEGDVIIDNKEDFGDEKISYNSNTDKSNFIINSNDFTDNFFNSRSNDTVFSLSQKMIDLSSKLTAHNLNIQYNIPISQPNKKIIHNKNKNSSESIRQKFDINQQQKYNSLQDTKVTEKKIESKTQEKSAHKEKNNIKTNNDMSLNKNFIDSFESKTQEKSVHKEKNNIKTNNDMSLNKNFIDSFESKTQEKSVHKEKNNIKTNNDMSLNKNFIDSLTNKIYKSNRPTDFKNQKSDSVSNLTPKNSTSFISSLNKTPPKKYYSKSSVNKSDSISPNTEVNLTKANVNAIPKSAPSYDTLNSIKPITPSRNVSLKSINDISTQKIINDSKSMLTSIKQTKRSDISQKASIKSEPSSPNQQLKSRRYKILSSISPPPINQNAKPKNKNISIKNIESNEKAEQVAKAVAYAEEITFKRQLERQKMIEQSETRAQEAIKILRQEKEAKRQENQLRANRYLQYLSNKNEFDSSSVYKKELLASKSTESKKSPFDLARELLNKSEKSQKINSISKLPNHSNSAITAVDMLTNTMRNRITKYQTIIKTNTKKTNITIKESQKSKARHSDILSIYGNASNQKTRSSLPNSVSKVPGAPISLCLNGSSSWLNTRNKKTKY